ncbi:MAG TPA: DNA modification methylase, partial [Actinobacteria bacterium]|nr:DNA modification methylase [Actinomycetota bacterium]
GSQTYKLSEWNPFADEAASWFDPEWMFGVTEGFDVVIGNPPYGADYPAEHKKYFQSHYESAKTISGKQKGSIDTFSLFIDKGFNLANYNSVLTYIVPMAIASSDSMTALHNMMFRMCETIYVSTYSNRPKKIFDNADQRVAIISCQKNGKPTKNLFTTKVNKRYEDTSVQKVIDGLQYVNSFSFVKYGRIPKVGTDIELSILDKIYKSKTTLSNLFDEKGKPVYYRSSGGRYYNIVTNFLTGSTKEKPVLVKPEYRNLIAALLSSNLYFWFYHIYSNNLDLKSYELEMFPIPIEDFNKESFATIEDIYKAYLKDLHKNSKIKKVSYAHVSEYREYYARHSKFLIDKIDLAIKDAYGLTNEEIQFIIKYDLKFRTDNEEE